MYFKSVYVVVVLLMAGLSSSASGNQNSYLDGRTSISLDYETVQCMECHDGVTARDVEMSFPGTDAGMSSLHTGKHPIGMNYRDYVLSTPLEYRPHNRLNSDTQLVNGQVSCVSCHRIRQNPSPSTESSRMAKYEATDCLTFDQPKKELGQSGLCQSCHIK